MGLVPRAVLMPVRPALPEEWLMSPASQSEPLPRMPREKAAPKAVPRQAVQESPVLQRLAQRLTWGPLLAE